MGLELFGHVIEALDGLGVAVGHAERDLVLEDVKARIVVDEVETFVVAGSGAGIKLVHLLLAGGDEDVAVCPLLNLCLEGARRVEVEANVHAVIGCFEEVARLGERLGERGRRKDDERLCLCRGRGVCRHRVCGLGLRASARHQSKACRDDRRQRKRPPGDAGACHGAFLSLGVMPAWGASLVRCFLRAAHVVPVGFAATDVVPVR